MPPRFSPHMGMTAALYLLLLQLADGALCPLQALAGGTALLSHHGQLTLDHVVLLGLLGACHLTLWGGQDRGKSQEPDRGVGAYVGLRGWVGCRHFSIIRGPSLPRYRFTGLGSLRI